MGNCCRKPARCAHAPSPSSSSEIQKPQSKSTLNHHKSINHEPSSTSPATKTSLTTTKGEVSARGSIKSFSFNDLKNATRNFRSDTLLGEGGFGYVFKGWMDENTFAPTRPGAGIVVAVKKLKLESFQGHKEWLAEVNYLGQLHHKNLVRLIGYCSESENRLLVYEFMPRGSLENHLFRRGVEPISWATRISIAIDVARGISFLHNLETKVIYRDLKASNILLDSEFNAKLSDFGLARDGPTGDDTHVSTKVVGTHGYAAPEYVATGHLTTKSDVYSFGVVLLELLSGKRALDERAGEETLVDWARPFISDGRRVVRIMDTKLCGRYCKKEAQATAALAFQCLYVDQKNRPPMKEVLTTLEQLHTLKDNPREKSKLEKYGMKNTAHNRKALEIVKSN